MKIITIAELQKLGACDEAQAWFNEKFVHGAELTFENLATVPEKRWVVWLASKLNPELRWMWAGIAFRYAAKRNPSLAKYADNVTAENWREARAAAAAADAYAAYADAAYTAAYADAYYTAAYAATAAATDAYAAAWDEMLEISITSLLQ